jgi:hypothetical protein
VRDDERRGQYLEAKYALGHRLFKPLRDERVTAFSLEPLGNDRERFHQISAGATTRVEHVHLRVGETVGDAKFGNEHLVHAPHHVAPDLLGRVPDAELLSQPRVERLQEGLVEVLHCVPVIETLEEFGASDAIESRGGEVERFLKPQRP